MKKTLNRRFSVFTVILLVLTAAYIAFIWIHSTMSAADSSVESGNVLNFLNDFLKMIGLPSSLTDHIVRKSAHFCEFALLGFLSFWSAYSLKKKFLSNLMPVGFVCLDTAVVDEYIQYFSAGRSAEVKDVLLDFCGAAAGVILIIIILGIVRLIKRR